MHAQEERIILAYAWYRDSFPYTIQAQSVCLELFYLSGPPIVNVISSSVVTDIFNSALNTLEFEGIWWNICWFSSCLFWIKRVFSWNCFSIKFWYKNKKKDYNLKSWKQTTMNFNDLFNYWPVSPRSFLLSLLLLISLILSLLKIFLIIVSKIG